VNHAARRYAGCNVPRYTSYPTAAEFTSAVTAADHAVWLDEMSGQGGISLYLHVPYCREICLYCGCHTKMAMRDDVVAAYRRALEAEIGMVASLAGPRCGIARLHWGGGTPSILGPDGLRSVIDVLRERFRFETGHEHAIELDPRYVTSGFAHGLAELGVTRASLGVQDLNPTVQAAIGRLQPASMVEAAVDRLRAAGIGSLSFDLMYGLPLRTSQSIRKTCASVISMSPDRIACFGYAHLPRLKANQRRIDEAKLPSLDERIEQAEVIAGELAGAGYIRIGIDHFAKPSDPLAVAANSGRLHRNFQGYTVDDCTTLLGLGASAISTFPHGFAQNMADVPRYIRTIEAGSLASVRGRRIGPEDRLRGRIIERLMCDFEVDLSAIAPDIDFSGELSSLHLMGEEGLVALDRSKLVVTEAGRPVVRVVAAAFDAFRMTQPSQFSTAI